MKNLGSVNAAFPCTVFKDNVAVGHCIDTPNSIAYAMSVTGATRAVGTFGTYERNDMLDRVTHSGWFSDAKSAKFSAPTNA